MRKIRKGKDIELRLALFDDDKQPVELVGRDLELMLVTPIMSKIKLDFTVYENVISATFKGKEQRIPGIYSLTLWFNKDKDKQNVVDYCRAFELVLFSCQEGGEQEHCLNVETVDLQTCFDIGIKGESAYEIALRYGFEGTEDDWLQSLKGEPGKDFKYDDFTTEQIEQLQKPATDAATEVQKTNESVKTAEQERVKAEILRQETFTELSEEMTEAINSIPVSFEILGDIND